MSEYQYYEFLALDRPLTDRQLAELRSLSTRAEITSTRFANEYHWGNFRGDPRTMMERYFDAFLYLANWGTRQLMFRLPREVLNSTTASPACRNASTRQSCRASRSSAPGGALPVRGIRADPHDDGGTPTRSGSGRHCQRVLA
jgi:hypothetical protein